MGYTFLDIYTLDVEARYAAEERAQTSGPLDPDTFYDFTPRVSLKAQINPDFMAYGSAAKGSKAGGFNTITADPGFETYDQETNWTYEIGIKQSLFDGRLQLNYNVFGNHWKDLQFPTAELAPFNPSSPSTDANYIVNASGADSFGAELEAFAALTDNWTVKFTASTRARVRRRRDRLRPRVPVREQLGSGLPRRHRRAAPPAGCLRLAHRWQPAGRTPNTMLSTGVENGTKSASGSTRCGAT